MSQQTKNDKLFWERVQHEMETSNCDFVSCQVLTSMSILSWRKNKEKGKKFSEEQETVTSSTYKSHGHKGYKGLQNAYEHVKERPAGAIISKLLEKYNLQLNDTADIGSILSDTVIEAENSGDLEIATKLRKPMCSGNRNPKVSWLTTLSRCRWRIKY